MALVTPVNRDASTTTNQNNCLGTIKAKRLRRSDDKRFINNFCYAPFMIPVKILTPVNRDAGTTTNQNNCFGVIQAKRLRRSNDKHFINITFWGMPDSRRQVGRPRKRLKDAVTAQDRRG